MIPDTSPPAMLVRFDPQQTTAADIAERAKVGLEQDTVVPTTYDVSFVDAQPELLDVAALTPVNLYAQTDLFVQTLQPGQVALSNDLFGCGTSMDLMLNGLSNMNGVLSADKKAVPGGGMQAGSTPLAIVSFDPTIVSSQDIAQTAQGILLSDPCLGKGMTVAVHLDQ